jgi:hypothetical protein
MRVVVALFALVVAASASAANPMKPRLDVVVPVDPYEHERLHYFGRRSDLPVPNAVTIDGAAYACDVHTLRFRDRDGFVAHLRTAHRAALERLPELLSVVDGRVHYVGD